MKRTSVAWVVFGVLGLLAPRLVVADEMISICATGYDPALSTLSAAGNQWVNVTDPRTLSAAGAMTAPGDNEFNRDANLGPYLVYKLPADVTPGESTADGKIWQIWIRFNCPTGRNSFWWQTSPDGVNWIPATFTNDNRWESRQSGTNTWFWQDHTMNNNNNINPTISQGANYLRITPRESDVLGNSPLFDVITLRNFGARDVLDAPKDEVVIQQLPCPTTADPCFLQPPPPPAWVSEFLITPSMAAAPGCGVTAAQIAGDWITGTADGNPVTDANIIPKAGMIIQPDFGAASQATGWQANISAAAQAAFWTIPGDAANTEGKLVLIKSPGSQVYDYQRADIFGFDVNDTMAVAFFYYVNPTNALQVLFMGFGSDDGGGVRVNGRPALSMQACRGTTAGQDKFRVCMDPGKNLVSFYAFEQGGGYGAAIRFEDADSVPQIVQTTTDPTGYDPAVHPACNVPPLPATHVPEVLVTPSMSAPPGCGVTPAQIRGDWINDGAGLTDANIVPVEGMEITPEFTIGDVTGASQAFGWDVDANGMGAAARDRFLTDPQNPDLSAGRLVKVTSGDGFYDWERGDIFAADANDTMCVAFFYAINETNSVQTYDMGFGSDDGGGVRVNGRVAHAMQACRGFNNYGDKFRVCLDPGKNLISLYTFEQGGGYNAGVRFEKLNGAPIKVPTTLDPAGYVPDPDGSLGMHPICTPVPRPDAPVYTELGLVTEFLVPGVVLDQGRTSNTKAGAKPEDYISINGEPPSTANVYEGAPVFAGLTGEITTKVRGADEPACHTFLTRFRGKVGGDPGLFDGEVFYAPNPDNYSSTLFFYLNNKTGIEQPVLLAFASDDAATLFLNGQRLLEFLTGRGFGGANQLQTGPGLANLRPGLNLVQLSYNEGGGGSGARVAVFDKCGGLLDPAEIGVSANPPGFTPGPAAPCALSCRESRPRFVPNFLITPSMRAIPGCGVTPDMIGGPWLNDGAGLTDENIVPFEGMTSKPDFGGASQALGWDTDANGMSAAARARFLVEPANPNSLGRILLVRSANSEVYDFQRADIFDADANDTMCVGFFYIVNSTNTVQVRYVGFGSDDGGGVRVNGKPVLRMQACRGTTAGQDKFRVCLDPGKNLISFYTFEQGGGYSAAFRFEDETGVPQLAQTTTDPTGYNPDPALHPACAEEGPVPPKGVFEVLVTPSMSAPPGCGVTPAQIRGDWISDGAGLTDANIVPVEGMEITPEFTIGGVAGASQAFGWDVDANGMGAAGRTRFLTDPQNPDLSAGRLVKVTSTNSFYDWERGDIFAFDVNDTMCVAFFYAINESNQVKTYYMGFGSDDGGGVRVNGRVALAMQACRGFNNWSDKFRVCLDPGKNLISFYTFEQGGGYNAGIRFETQNGAPITVPTTLDPAGYAADAHPICTPDPIPDAPVYTPDGIVTQYLVPAAVLDQGRTSNTKAGAEPEDYISINGAIPSADNVREGALVGAGLTGDITTKVRGGTGCDTHLVMFKGKVGPDPGLFNGESFYGNPDNYSSTLFLFLNNKTGGDEPIRIGFASDDAASLFLNGQLVLEYLVGRGFGGANAIQTGPALVTLPPGLSLVQLSYTEGGGGSGGRIGIFDGCGDLLDPTRVEPSANPPGYQPGPIPGCNITCDGDTHATDLAVAGPADKGPGVYTATATAKDDNNGPIQYTFTASNGIDPPSVKGPQDSNKAEFDLSSGCPAKPNWTLSVSVDDTGDCDTPAGDASLSKPVALTCATWVRGDTNGDKALDISDPVASLNFQFTGGATPACRPALDINEDGEVNIADPVKQLNILFLGDPLPPLYQKCENFAGCAVNCP